MNKHLLRIKYKEIKQKYLQNNSQQYLLSFKNNLEIIIKNHPKSQKQYIIIGSYIHRQDQLQPPHLFQYKYAYPWFCAKNKNDRPVLMEFKIVQNIDNLTQSVYGIKIPNRNILTVYPQFVLVPLLCFNPSNMSRIGYGGGYYDRYMRQIRRQNKNVLFIGLGLQQLKYNELICNQYDEPLDYVITQKQIYYQ